MSDQCKHCTVRGDINACLSTECFHHENWYAVKQQERIDGLQAENAKLKQERDNYAEISIAKWCAKNYANKQAS